MTVTWLRRGSASRIGRLVLAVVVLGFGWMVAPHAVSHPLLRPDSSGDADAIVTYGSTSPDACALDAGSQHRVALATRLFAEHRAPYVVFAGGRAREELTCAAAAIMARTAQGVGVPIERLRIETTAVTTREAAVRSAAIVRALGLQRVLVVADALEMLQSERYFRELGYSVERASVPPELAYNSRLAQLTEAIAQHVRWWVSQPSRTADVRSAVAIGGNRQPPACADGHDDGSVALLGTSYAASWPLTSVAGLPVTNKGRAGAHTPELAQRLADDILPHHPRAVIIWGFDNDLIDSPPEGIHQAITDVERHYLAMVDRTGEAGVDTILATEVTMGRVAGLYEGLATRADALLGRPTYSDRINEAVLELNVWLRELARRRQLLLLDLQPVLSDRLQVRRPEFATADGSHITPAGYRALTAHAEPQLRAHFDRRRACSQS